jgi:hypothetical protein
MNENCLINCLSYLDLNNLIELFHYRKDYFKIFFKNLIKNYINNKKIINNLSITNFLNYVPLPTYFKYNIYEIKINNHYEFNENNENTIMQSNICLPHPTISPIPFTFGYIKKNKYKLVNSNIFYYEVKLEESNYNYNNSLISIGYGSISNLIINYHVGEQNNSVGLHSNTGKVFINKSKNGIKLINQKIKNGDILGAGLIYLKNDYYRPFFTLNGKLLYLVREVILTGLLTPQISCRKIYGINVNLSQKKFKYNIEQLINSFSNIISTKNNYILKNYDIKLFKFISRRLNNINFSNKTEPIYFPIPTVNINFNPLNTSNQINSFVQNITNTAINSLQSPINNSENISNLPYGDNVESDVEEEIIEENNDENNLLMYSDNILNFFENGNLN